MADVRHEEGREDVVLLREDGPRGERELEPGRERVHHGAASYHPHGDDGAGDDGDGDDGDGGPRPRDPAPRAKPLQPPTTPWNPEEAKAMFCNYINFAVSGRL